MNAPQESGHPAQIGDATAHRNDGSREPQTPGADQCSHGPISPGEALAKTTKMETKMNAQVEIKPGGIVAALAAAQAQMGKAIKGSSNPHFRSKYADLAEVMDACLPALNANGIAVTQPIRDVDGRLYCVTVLSHAGGESLECHVPLIVQKNDMQGLGSAITYARRYGLMSMAGIAPEDDDGNAAAAAAPKQGQEAVAKAIEYLSEADSLEALQTRWGNIPGDVKSDKRVIAAKDAAKERLSKPAADLGGDEVPY